MQTVWPLPTFGSSHVRDLMRKQLIGPTAEYLNRPSKSVRGRLVVQGFQLASAVGKQPTQAEQQTLNRLAAALEMIHAGSLILDDIQDQSHERRGRPAFHVEHGSPAAITVGSWLLAWPQQIIATLAIGAEVRQKLSEMVLATVTDAHYGQLIDVTTRVDSLSTEELPAVAEFVARSKTGYLTACALVAGALIAGCTESQRVAIARLGEALGILLQRLDDLGNFWTPRTGHKRFEDLLNGRVTWVWAWLAAHNPERREAMRKAVMALPDDREAVVALASELDLCDRAQLEARMQFLKVLHELEPFVEQGLLQGLQSLAEELVRAFLR